MSRAALAGLGILSWPACGLILGLIMAHGEGNMAHPITKNVRTVESLHALGGPDEPVRILRARAVETQHQGHLIRVQFEGTGPEPLPLELSWDPENDPQNPIGIDLGLYDDRGRRTGLAISKEEARIVIQSLERMLGQ